MILIHRSCHDCDGFRPCSACDHLGYVLAECEAHELTTAEVADVLHGDFTWAERAEVLNELVARVQDERETDVLAEDEAQRRAA